jgi:putative MFS transporter
MAETGDAVDIAARLERLPGSRTLWGVITLIALGGFFEHYDLFMTAYVSPGLIAASVFKGARKGMFGLTDQASFAAATFAGLFLGTMLFSQVADRMGRRTIFTASLLWYTAATLVMAAQDTALGVDLWRLIAGVGIGVELVTIDTYVVEFAPASLRGRAIALTQFVSFLAVPTVAFACWLLADRSVFGLAGWRWVMILGAVAAAAVWAIRARLPESPRWLAAHGRTAEADAVMRGLEARIAAEGRTLAPPVPAPAEETGQGRFAELFRRPIRGRLVLLSIFNFAQTIGFYGFGNWVPSLIAAQGHGLTKSLAWSFLIACAFPLAPLLFGSLTDRVERKWQIVAAALGTATFGLAFAAQSAPAALIACGVAVTLSNNLLSMAFHTYQAEVFPTRIRARAVGFVYSWSRISTVLTSFMIAFVLQEAGTRGVFAFIAAAMAVVVVTIGGFGPRTRRRALEAIAS